MKFKTYQGFFNDLDPLVTEEERYQHYKARAINDMASIVAEFLINAGYSIQKDEDDDRNIN